MYYKDFKLHRKHHGGSENPIPFTRKNELTRHCDAFEMPLATQ
jgi:hypothetical protein